MADSTMHKIILLAQVKWFKDHPRRDYFHRSVIVCDIHFQPDSSSTFIPVSRIIGRCTILKKQFNFEYGNDCVTIVYIIPPFILFSYVRHNFYC